jgi:hypothetical protein
MQPPAQSRAAPHDELDALVHAEGSSVDPSGDTAAAERPDGHSSEAPAPETPGAAAHAQQLESRHSTGSSPADGAVDPAQRISADDSSPSADATAAPPPAALAPQLRSGSLGASGALPTAAAASDAESAEEEPRLKYQRLGCDLTTLLATASAACLAISDKVGISLQCGCAATGSHNTKLAPGCLNPTLTPACMQR